MGEKNKSKSRWQRIREHWLWKKRHYIFLIIGAFCIIIGAISGGYPMLFFGLALVGFALATWYEAVKKWIGLDKLNIGAGSLKTHNIAQYGPKIPGDKKPAKLTGEDFFTAFLNGENEHIDQSGAEHKEFFSGIRYFFTKNLLERSMLQDKEKEKSDESEKKLHALLNGYNGIKDENGRLTDIGYVERIWKKDKDGNKTKDIEETKEHTKGRAALEAFFRDQINEYINAKINDENRYRGYNKADKNKYDLLFPEGYSQDKQEKEVEQLAIKMANAFHKYLEKRKAESKNGIGNFELEDFKLKKGDDGSIVEDKEEKSKDFLSEFIKQDIKKQNIRGLGGYRKFVFEGAVIGGLSGLIVWIVEKFVDKFRIAMTKMYGGIENLSGPLGILVGIILTAVMFALGKYVYSSKEPDLPKDLKLSHPPKQTENTVTLVTNPSPSSP